MEMSGQAPVALLRGRGTQVPTRQEAGKVPQQAYTICGKKSIAVTGNRD